ncbi:putative ethanolamine kinase [Helianthus annuus]|nr:putative ethanolamine kinase [Helianthus annuus]
MTNIVYRITWPKNTAEDDVRTVLVRIYGEGTDIFFDREEEIRTFGLISTHGHGPHLLAKFPEGRVEEFIHANVHFYMLLLVRNGWVPILRNIWF